MKKYIKWLVLITAISAGAISILHAPEAIESFLPAVNTVTPIKSEYCETVQGSGIIFSDNDSSQISELNNLNNLSENKNTARFVRIAINESDIRQIKKGQKAQLRGAAFDDGKYMAKVIATADTAHQNTMGNAGETVVDVTLEITNADDTLRSGYTAQATIETGETHEVLLIPYDTIMQDDDGEYVYILQNHTAIRRNIKTGAELPEGAEILSGVDANDMIITAPESVENDKLVKNN